MIKRIERFSTIALLSICFMLFSAAKASAFTLKNEQPASSSAGQLEVVSRFKGKTDIIVERNRLNLWDACNGQNGSSVSISDDKTGTFSCRWYNGSNEGSHVRGLGGSHASIGINDMSTYNGVGIRKTKSYGSYSIGITFANAAMKYDGSKYYDIYMSISNISTIIGDQTGWSDSRNALALIYGYQNGGIDLSAFSYVGGNFHNYQGVNYDVSVRLREHGSSKNLNNQLLWAFNDIDIKTQLCGDPDTIEGCTHDYYDVNKYNAYAEHVTINSGLADSEVSVVKSPSSILGLTGNAIYHRSGTEGASWDGNVDNNHADAVALIYGDSFNFNWGGSSCATAIVDTPAALFIDRTTIDFGAEASIGNSKERRIHSEKSPTITFNHFLRRNNIGPPSAVAKYYVNVNSLGTAKSSSTVALGRGSENEKKVYTNSISNLTLKPDETKVLWQTIHYTRTTLNDKAIVTKPDNNDCTISGYTASGRQCISVYRPPAYFEGEVFAEGIGKNSAGGVIANQDKKETLTFGSSDSDAASDQKDIYIQLPSSSGKYSVKVSHTIKRRDTKDDSAGDRVSTTYLSYTRKRDYFKVKKDYYEQDGNSTTRSLSTALYDGSNTTSKPNSQNNYNKTFSSDQDGELLYGEERVYCTTLNLATKQKGDGKQKSRTICVHVTRDPKTCTIADKKQPYGVNIGQNYGRVGVKNLTFENSDMVWTDVNFDVDHNHFENKTLLDVYAKPGDSIRYTHQMCAGAFYTVEVNGLKNNSQYNTRYRSEGEIKKSDYNYFGNKTDGYLFKDTAAIARGKYGNPAEHDLINGKWWRWTNGINAGILMEDKGFMSSLSKAEGSVDSPDTESNTYNCVPNDRQTTNKGGYQVSGKKDGCHTDMFDKSDETVDKFDVGGVIEQRLSWNNLRVNITNTADRTVTVTNPDQELTAIATVKIPYNYILKPFVENDNVGGKNEKVVYLGETYTMHPGVVTAGRANYIVTHDKQPYATITKETGVVIRTYLTRNGEYIDEIGGEKGNQSFNRRFNEDGNLNNAEDRMEVEFRVTDSDTPSRNTPQVGDKICTEIKVWPADSHNEPDAVYDSKDKGGANGSTPALLGIALTERTDGDELNYRTTTSCSMVAKRPTMSVESSNAYSKSGYNMGRYTKDISVNSGAAVNNNNFGSWSEYGVFGKIHKFDEHLISGAAVGYNRSSSYYHDVFPAGQEKNKTRLNSGDVSTGKISSKVCIFETQTFANVNCENNNVKVNSDDDPKNVDIGGQSVIDYKQKILDRYGSSGGVKASTEGKWGDYDIVSPLIPLGEGSDYLVKYTNNSGGSGAMVVNLGEKSFISQDTLPREYEIPNSFKDDNGNEIDYNRTLVLNAKGGTVVIDSNIFYNGDSKNKLDDIVGVVIIADNVYFTDNPDHIDAVIIAENEVNTCKYAGGVEMKIGAGATLNSDVCNKKLVFEAPVITNKLVLNRTYGAENGVASIQRAEIFNLNMANYLWSFNQMSRYSQAVTTYSRELPSRY